MSLQSSNEYLLLCVQIVFVLSSCWSLRLCFRYFAWAISEKGITSRETENHPYPQVTSLEALAALISFLFVILWYSSDLIT